MACDALKNIFKPVLAVFSKIVGLAIAILFSVISAVCPRKMYDFIAVCAGSPFKAFLNIGLPILDVLTDLNFTVGLYRSGDIKFCLVSGIFISLQKLDFLKCYIFIIFLSNWPKNLKHLLLL